MIITEGNNLLDVAMAPTPGLDVVVGGFTYHSVNNIPFSGIDSEGYAVLRQPLILSSLTGLTLLFSWSGYQDFSTNLFCDLHWTPDFTPSDPAFAPPYYAVNIEVPMSGSYTRSVNINQISNAGYGYMPRGNWLALFRTMILGGGPGASFAVRGIVLQ